MPEILRPEPIELTDAEVEAVSGGQTARAGDGGDGGRAGNFNFSFTNAGDGGAGGDATARG